MKLLAFELCTLHLFSKSQQSYTTDIFETEIIFDEKNFSNSRIALNARCTGQRKWMITYFVIQDGQTYQQELLVNHHLKCTNELLTESDDAPPTKQSHCGLDFLRNRARNEDPQPILLTNNVLVEILKQEKVKDTHVGADLFLTYSWTEPVAPRVYIQVVSGTTNNEYKKKMPSYYYVKDMLGPFIGKIHFGSILEPSDFNTGERENLYFDLGRLVTKIPKDVYRSFRNRLEKIVNIVTDQQPGMEPLTFDCPNRYMFDQMPSIVMKFTQKKEEMSYTLTHQEYIVELPSIVTRVESGPARCYFALDPHEKMHDWIFGATFAKKFQMKMALLSPLRVQIGFMPFQV
ncbi:hypothetical protein ABG067_004991 [Albugo candida]